MSKSPKTLPFGCKPAAAWNALCCTVEYSHLLFESLDADKSSRTFSPIFAYDPLDVTKTNTTVNSFSHKAPNILLGIVRLSRFPIAIANTSPIPHIKLNYAGT